MKRGMIALLAATSAHMAMAQEPEAIAPEILTVEESIRPGTNIFVTDMKLAGASNVNVLGAEDLKLKGNVTSGVGLQMTTTKDGGLIYTAAHYFKRIVAGPDDAVLQEWDTSGLKLLREIPISDKLVLATNQPTMLALTADEKFALIQNATPATSVSVVSLDAGEQIAEIPTPGCWTIMPALEGLKFSTICGDGTLTSYNFKADGTYGDPVKGKPFFDPDTDPVFTSPATAGPLMLFASFNGNIYLVDQSGDEPVLKDTFSITEGVEGGWAPGGGEVIAYNAPSNMAFVLMHPDAKEGSHKEPAKEIWAVDLGTKKVLYRSPAHGEDTIVSTQTDVPIVYAGGEGQIRRYEVDPDAKYAVKAVVEVEGYGSPGIIRVVE